MEKIYLHAPVNDSIAAKNFQNGSKKFHLYVFISHLLLLVFALAILFAPLSTLHVQINDYSDSETWYEKDYHYSSLDAIKGLIATFSEKYDVAPSMLMLYSLDTNPAFAKNDVANLKEIEFTPLQRSANLTQYIYEVSNNIYDLLEEEESLLEKAGISKEERKLVRIESYNINYSRLASLVELFRVELESRNADGLKLFLKYASVSETMTDSEKEDLNLLMSQYLVGDYDITAIDPKAFREIKELTSLLPDVGARISTFETDKTLNSFAYYEYDTANNTYKHVNMRINSVYFLFTQPFILMFSLALFFVMISALVKFLSNNCKKIQKNAAYTSGFFLIIFVMLFFKGMEIFSMNAMAHLSRDGMVYQAINIPLIAISVAAILVVSITSYLAKKEYLKLETELNG